MTLTESLKAFKAATSPEDIFGKVVAQHDLKRRFHYLAKVVHPDGKTGKMLVDATEAFKLLNEWHEKAEAKIANGTYGDLTVMTPVIVKTKKAVYTLTRKLPGGDIANVYTGSYDKYKLIFKVGRSPANNDLMENERDILTYLWTDAVTAKLAATNAHISEPRDSFELAAGPVRKRVNVVRLSEGYYTLAEVKEAYPGGIDLRDAAWMLNRLFGALLILEQAGVVHNAVLPEHILIHPDKHNARLIDFSYATKGKSAVKAIVSARKAFYPAEVLAKKPTSTATDIYMAVASVLWVVDAATVPRNVQGLLKSCLLGQRARPQEVWALFKEFGVELEKAFGPKKFRVFTMPVKSKAVI